MDLKKSNPVEAAEYAFAHGIDQEPVFVWWVLFTLKKQNRIIAAVNRQFVKKTHKYRIRVPRNLVKAERIDRENGNTLWMDAIKKEMAAINVAFRFLEDDAEIAPGFQEVLKNHLVFDVKMEDF